MENRKVGLWAKQYMTSPEYKYMGTLLTTKSVESVIGQRQPALQNRSVADCKTEREEKVCKTCERVLNGVYREQFVGKLDDALAISKRNWVHFADSRGAPPATLFRLPRELGALVSARRASKVRELHAVRVEEEETATAIMDAVGAKAETTMTRNGQQTLRTHS